MKEKFFLLNMEAKVKEICHKLGLKPLKRRGQNFLTNPKILATIIKAGELKKNDIVLEVGPGLGILTQELAKKVRKVIAVEIDTKLTNYLKEKFKNYKNIKIIQGDILKFKISNLKIQNYKIIANLPYNITGAVLKKFLSEKPKPKLMVLMIQKEVAERIVERSNKRSIISLMVKFYGKPEIISYVSKNNFWPRPKVDSSILRIKEINKKYKLKSKEEKKFFKLIRDGFSSPRKQLVNNLAKIIKKEEIKKIFKKIGFDPKIRAENLNLDNWFTLYKLIYGK